MPRSYHPRSIKAADILWCYGTTGFPAKWFLRNERRNSILMTRHYPYLGSASDWSCGKCASANQKRYPDLGSVNVISMEFVHSILRRYYAKCRLFSQASDPAAQRLYVLPFQAYEQPVLPVSTKRFWIKRTRIHPFQISHPLSQNQSGYILTTDCSPVCRWICSFVLWCLVTWCTTRSCSPVLVFLTLNPPWSAWLSYSSLYFHLIMR